MKQPTAKRASPAAPLPSPPRPTLVSVPGATGPGREPRAFASGIDDLRKLLRIAGLRETQLVVPLTLGFVSSVSELASTALLLPLVQALVSARPDPSGSLSILGGPSIPIPTAILPSRPYLLAYLGVLVFAFFALSSACAYWAAADLSRKLQRYLDGLRKALYGRFLSFGKAYFDRTSQGHVQYLLIDGAGRVGGTLLMGHGILQATLFFLSDLIVMMTISWKITLAGFVLFPLVHLWVGKVTRKAKEVSRQQSQNLSALNRRMADTLLCMPLVKAHSTEKREWNAFGRLSEEAAYFEYATTRRQRALQTSQEILFFGGLLVFFVAISFFFMSDDAAGNALYLVLFYLMRRAFLRLSEVNYLRVRVASVDAQVAEILDTMSDDGKYRVPSGTLEFQGLKQEIIIENLCFRYREETSVLRNVSFSIPKGRTTALVGPSGAGKSTIVSLIQRLYDCPSGSILLDGVDIRHLTVGSLHGRIGFVSQDALLFNDTLRHNLAYGLESEPSAERITEVLERTCLLELVSQLPQGLDTVVGDRGVRLSGGEKQRVTIARAILRECEILILDEATSALDSLTERQIQKAIQSALVGRTAIVIAHRLSTIQRADNIVVLEAGRKVEEGTFETLLSARGLFYRMYSEQKFLVT